MNNKYKDILFHEVCSLSLMYFIMYYECPLRKKENLDKVHSSLSLKIADYMCEASEDEEQAISSMKSFLSSTCCLTTDELDEISDVWHKAIMQLQMEADNEE